MIEIIEKLLPLGHPNRPGIKIEKPIAIVDHWTSNMSPNADAHAHYNYFSRDYFRKDGKTFEQKQHGKPDKHFRFGCAHITVDSKGIVLMVPLNEMTYHVGGSRYKGTTPTHNIANANQMMNGVEICVNDHSPEGWYAALRNAALAKQYIIEYWAEKGVYLTIDEHNIRHYDVKGKDCPAMMLPMTLKNYSGTYTVDWNWYMYKGFTKEVIKNYLITEEQMAEVSAAPPLTEPELIQVPDNLINNDAVYNPEGQGCMRSTAIILLILISATICISQIL